MLPRIGSADFCYKLNGGEQGRFTNIKLGRWRLRERSNLLPQILSSIISGICYKLNVSEWEGFSHFHIKKSIRVENEKETMLIHLFPHML